MRAILFGLGLTLMMTTPTLAQAPAVRHQSATSPEQALFLIPSTEI